MSTDKKYLSYIPEIWGGIECTINRIENSFQDQLTLADHYARKNDIDQFASLGIKALRYPVLWERHQPTEDTVINWTWAEEQLTSIRRNNIKPIVGLLHHGSGPEFTNLLDPLFAEKFSRYAKKVAEKFSWIEYYTPVNEPHTTARFSGLYGLWYPHTKNTKKYAVMLLNQLKATVLAMGEIRKINPDAKLVQTEDLSQTHSTYKLRYQANFENKRRWLTYDILCGKLDKRHSFWKFFRKLGIPEKDLLFFVENPCVPDVMGLNYYVTSERFLDDKISKYPKHMRGGNGRHRYVDVEAVRRGKPVGLGKLIAQAWDRFRLPVAITEVHLSCTREEQMRWFHEAWKTCCQARENGIDLIAVTAWSLLGAFDWASLLTKSERKYETGVFDLSDNGLRKTATTRLITELAHKGSSSHPLVQQKGWWHGVTFKSSAKPIVMIIGKNGTLGGSFAKACINRSIDFVSLSRDELDICNQIEVNNAIEYYKPLMVINTAGYVQVENAEIEHEKCFAINTHAPLYLAKVCARKGIKFMTFSSDLVFDGVKKSPYAEHDKVRPLNVYGKSKADCEQEILTSYPHSLIIRTSAFFSPHDHYNFAYNVISALKHNQPYTVLQDVYVSPTYVPDLVDAALDLCIDDESGIWHLANDGDVTWAEFAGEIAARSGLKKSKLISKPLAEMNYKAARPLYSSLISSKGIKLPALDNALERFFHEKVNYTK